MNKKIGIYPAAFDPVHAGHIAFSQAAIAEHALDKVFLVPEPTPRHKQGVKALTHRTAMLQLAAAEHDSFGIVSLDKQRLTMHELWPLLVSRFQGAELYMLLGSDATDRMLSWPDVADYAETVPHFIIARRNRKQADVHHMMDMLQGTKKLDITYSLIADEDTSHSSQAIRTALKQGNTPQGIHQSVLDYIHAHRLYISGAA